MLRKSITNLKLFILISCLVLAGVGNALAQAQTEEIDLITEAEIQKAQLEYEEGEEMYGRLLEAEQEYEQNLAEYHRSVGQSKLYMILVPAVVVPVILVVYYLVTTYLAKRESESKPKPKK